MIDNELPPLPDASAPRRYICTECGYVGEVGPTHVKSNSEACYYLALEIPARFGADQMRDYARAVERAVYERAAQLRDKRGLTCLWSRADDDTDTWETACRHAFTIIEGTPTDNHMEFCCYCGRPLEQEIGDSDAE